MMAIIIIIAYGDGHFDNDEEINGDDDIVCNGRFMVDLL